MSLYMRLMIRLDAASTPTKTVLAVTATTILGLGLVTEPVWTGLTMVVVLSGGCVLWVKAACHAVDRLVDEMFPPARERSGRDVVAFQIPTQDRRNAGLN